MQTSTAIDLYNDVLSDYADAGCDVEQRLIVLSYALYLLAEDNEFYGTPLSLVQSLGGIWEE